MTFSATGAEARHLLFAHYMRLPDDQVDLAVAALLIAEEEFPGLDVAGYMEQVDRLADHVRKRLPRRGEKQAAVVISHLRSELFDVEGFSGDEDDYYNPRNNYFNQVLDRKRGIPITLSILYIEVARRLGLELQGVGFPGHFLVKHVMEGTQIVMDPFFGGRTLDLEDLRDLLRNVADREDMDPSYLEPVPKREILARTLRNLRANYLRLKDPPRELAALERLLLLEPNNETLTKECHELQHAIAHGAPDMSGKRS